MMKSVLVAAIVLFFMSIWIVVPAPVLLLLPLAVVVPEFSPILLVVTLVFGGLTLVTRKSRIKTAALSLAVMTLAMCSVPLARVAVATLAVDRTLGLDEEPHGRMRPRSLVLGDLVRGIDAGGARVASGVEFARPDGHPLTLTIYRPTFSGRFPIVPAWLTKPSRRSRQRGPWHPARCRTRRCRPLRAT